MVSKVGNLVDSSVPVSQDEDKDNLVVRTWGSPRDPAGMEQFQIILTMKCMYVFKSNLWLKRVAKPSRSALENWWIRA